ncbi:hypothetical protein CCACVL1_24857 [Corchorus capsularis]|uniref:Uncharacterized protein n=1 Tax=Corchorus capsularis TaxID=210143 RepID=A0A1R3GMW4_COCAP|nr:hypothetical protein CCACVL1_24857 [Corchorus capsularis]
MAPNEMRKTCNNRARIPAERKFQFQGTNEDEKDGKITL